MTTDKKQLIPSTDEAWETGQLGSTEEFMKRADAEQIKAIDDALKLQMISIRLPKSVIEEFKFIAEYDGIGYQPLMREALIRFADCEMKRIARDVVAAKQMKEKDESARVDVEKQRHAA